MKSILSSRTTCTIAALIIAATMSSAHATPVNLVTNGSFEAVTGLGTLSSEFGSRYNAGSVQETGWTNTGYSFVFKPGTADNTATWANSEFGPNDVGLWGPGDGAPGNGLTATSPDGGNFLAMDGLAAYHGPLSQVISGLTLGATYNVSFWFAAAQQAGFTGETTEDLDVTFGTGTQSTGFITNANHGFTGWQKVNMTFVAGSTSQTLTFLAQGTPDGFPPMSLLDGVSVTAATPEPGSLALLATGLLGAGGMLRRRFVKA